MPSRPEFDLYEALETNPTASATEITSNYRRLAREHHPDKNPDNVEATEKMQRINAAHDVLSNTGLRAEYDSTPSTPESGSSTPFYNFDDDNRYGAYGYREEYINECRRHRFNTQQGRTHRSGGFYAFFPYDTPRQNEYQAETDRLAEEEERRTASLRAEERAKQQEKFRKEQAVKVALAEKKKREELAQQMAKEKEAEEEKDRQEEIWKLKKVTTAAEKRKWCLHTIFWPRFLNKSKSKYKCMRCDKKRGPYGFKCPHCGLLQCQACLSNFNPKRAST